jgi:hypothetical protein
MEKQKYGMSREDIANKLRVFETTKGKLRYIERIGKKSRLLRPETRRNLFGNGIKELTGSSYSNRDFLENIYTNEVNRASLCEAINDNSEDVDNLERLMDFANFYEKKGVDSHYSGKLYKKILSSALEMEDWHPFKQIKPGDPALYQPTPISIGVNSLVTYLNAIEDVEFKEKVREEIVDRMIKHNMVGNRGPEYLTGCPGNLTARFIEETGGGETPLRKAYHAETISCALGKEGDYKKKSHTFDAAKKLGERGIYKELADIFLDQLSDSFSEDLAYLATEAGRLSEDKEFYEKVTSQVRKPVMPKFEAALEENNLCRALELSRIFSESNLEDRVHQKARELVDSDNFGLREDSQGLGDVRRVIDYARDTTDKPLRNKAFQKAYETRIDHKEYEGALQCARGLEDEPKLREASDLYLDSLVDRARLKTYWESVKGDIVEVALSIEKRRNQKPTKSRNDLVEEVMRCGDLTRESLFGLAQEFATPQDYIDLMSTHIDKLKQGGIEYYSYERTIENDKFLGEFIRRAGEEFDSHPLAVEICECGGNRRVLERIHSRPENLIIPKP